MKARSIQAKNADDLNKKTALVVANGFKPTLAFVFISEEVHLKETMDLMKSNNIDVFGAFSSGEFTEDGIQEGGISILFLELDRANYKIKILDLTSISTLEAAREIGKEGISNFINPAYLVCGADLSTPGEFIINGITEVAGPQATIIGGISGEPVFFKGIVFTNNQAYKKGIIGLILDMDKVELQGLAVSGWKTAGTLKTITMAQNSWVKEIDNLPALDILVKYIGQEAMTDEIVGADHIVRLNANYPMQVQRKSGYTVMRPPLLANLEEKTIFCGGVIEEGDVFRFCIPPDFDVIDNVIDSSIKAKETTMQNADALVVFSCAGRLSSLGPMLETELNGLAATWGSPMVGFFCLGEFGKSEGADVSEFHGTTCSWVALKEK